jgi:hypothetical protein
VVTPEHVSKFVFETEALDNLLLCDAVPDQPPIDMAITQIGGYSAQEYFSATRRKSIAIGADFALDEQTRPREALQTIQHWNAGRYGAGIACAGRYRHAVISKNDIDTCRNGQRFEAFDFIAGDIIFQDQAIICIALRDLLPALHMGEKTAYFAALVRPSLIVGNSCAYDLRKVGTENAWYDSDIQNWIVAGNFSEIRFPIRIYTQMHHIGGNRHSRPFLSLDATHEPDITSG